MSMTIKEMAAALNLKPSTLNVYLSKNVTHPSAVKAKEAAMAMGWVPNYKKVSHSHTQAMRLIEEVIPGLSHKPFCTIKDISQAIGLNIQTIKRAYANTDKRNEELEAAIRAAGEKMGYIPGYCKPRKEKPITFYWGGNYHNQDEEIARMKQLREAGYTNAEIARKIGRAYKTVLNNLGKQPEMMTERSRHLASTFRMQTRAARAAYLRNKPIAEYNQKVEEHNLLKARLNALQLEILTSKPRIEEIAEEPVICPNLNLHALQPTALN